MATIRETGANDEADFSYKKSTNILDFDAIDAFIDVNTGRWKGWNNQIAGGNSAAAADASQPLYVTDEGPSFDGAAYYFSIAHAANQLLTGGFTFAWSFLPDTETNGDRIIDKSDTNNVGAGFAVWQGASAGTLSMRVNDAPTVTSSAVFETGKWQHAIMTVSAAGAVTFYRNNVAAGTGNANACSGITSTNPLRIGALWAATTSFFDGQIDDFFIFPGVITADDRAELYYASLYKTQLARAFSRSLPAESLTPPDEFNDQLNLSRSCDGTTVSYATDPYDEIDFTVNPTETINHYYVDYVNGNNSNAGTSAGAAWKTLAKANTSAVSPAVIHLLDEWVGYQNRTPAVMNWTGKFKFKSDHASGVTRGQGTRESYVKATFAWVDEGGGCWSTTEASTSATIFDSLGAAMFDANFPDADGIAMPLPDVGSSAACIATPGSQYHDEASRKKWVHLIDGREPDPYDGWIYCQAATSWQDVQLADDGVLLYEGIHVYGNLETSTTAIFRYRHTTTAANNSKLGKKNCAAVGGSGNGFESYDAKIMAFSGCIGRYNHADNYNYHSFQTTGVDGEWITVYEYNCKGSHAGYNASWYNQPALGTSCNASTAHDSIHIERVNCTHLGGNGATVADVNGCVSVNWGVTAGAATGTASPKACFWHEKYNHAGTYEGMWLWGCSADDDGDSNVLLLTNQGQTGGDGSNDGEIRVKHWRGQTDGAVTGTIKRFDGVAW